jgi:signal transduction histidine kinase
MRLRGIYPSSRILRINNSMNRIARLVGLAAVLLIVFLAAVLASGLRLQRHSEQIRLAALQAKRSQLEHFLALTHPTAAQWTDAYVKDLASTLDVQVRVLPATAVQGTSVNPMLWQFDHPVRDDTGQVINVLQVSAQPPPTVRLGEAYRQTAMILLVLALGLLVVLVTALLINTRQLPGPEVRAAASSASLGKEFDSLTHLAKSNLQQGADLKRERSERLRADEDLHFQQILLNRSLEEKIQLGRELHDGIIQALYATGLTFEAAKNQLAQDPVAAARQLDSGLKALNATIRDVRSYISGLSPENLRQQSFADSVHSLTQTLTGGRATEFDLKIDDSAAARLTDAQSTDLLQIIREAISNGLRHGDASKITVRLHESAGEIGLLIQDNGQGFDPAKLAARGHGLDNLQARAERIGATLRITSAPGEGTRAVVTLPVDKGTAIA